MSSDDSSPAQVLIVGGGFAAVEAALALRALAGDLVRPTLLSPDPGFRYRPAATLEAFQDGDPLIYDLRTIAADVRGEYRKGLLQSVASHKRYVRTAGTRLHYDALVLATGTRATAGIPGALTFRDQRDVRLIRPLLEELDTGSVSRVVFAVPTGLTWPLPIYELSLLSAARAQERGVEAEVSLVSAEREPLAVFGAQASRLVAGVLQERGVRFIGGVVPAGVRRDSGLMLQSDDAVAADRVVAVPVLRGRRITGVPASWQGFVPVDLSGRVESLEDVYAAGDITSYPIKQGGLATQQADRVAHTIASRLGAPVKEFRADLVLRARLLGGEHPVFLRTELDANGQPTAATLERPERQEAADSGKLFARYLTPYLETLKPVSADRVAAA